MIGHDPSRTYRAAVDRRRLRRPHARRSASAGSRSRRGADRGRTGRRRLHERRRASRPRRCCTPPGAGIDDPLAWTRAKRDDSPTARTSEMAEHERIHLVRGWASTHPARDPHVVARRRRRLGPRRPCGTRRDRRRIDAGDGPDRRARRGPVVTNIELFELDTPPESLLSSVVAPIAIEMATAFAALGTRVDIVEQQDRLLSIGGPADHRGRRTVARGHRACSSTSAPPSIGSTAQRPTWRTDPTIEGSTRC